MQTMKDLIERRKKDRKDFEVKFKIIDDDVMVGSGAYNGLTFSDIAVFNIGYIEYISKCFKVNDGVRMVAKSILEERKKFSENIDREIALGNGGLL